MIGKKKSEYIAALPDGTKTRRRALLHFPVGNISPDNLMEQVSQRLYGFPLPSHSAIPAAATIETTGD